MITGYTDGSCSVNPNGVGSWAYVVVDKKKVLRTSKGYEKSTTNNRMELLAILECAKNEDVSIIYSDSLYSVNCGSGIYKAKANLDLVLPLREIVLNKNISLCWIKGHNGDEFNEMADNICEIEMRERYKEINGIEFVAPFFYNKKSYGKEKV